mgnify:CR=1 FL=1
MDDFVSNKSMRSSSGRWYAGREIREDYFGTITVESPMNIHLIVRYETNSDGTLERFNMNAYKTRESALKKIDSLNEKYSNEANVFFEAETIGYLDV